jgi:hypothetical protein
MVKGISTSYFSPSALVLHAGSVSAVEKVRCTAVRILPGFTLPARTLLIEPSPLIVAKIVPSIRSMPALFISRTGGESGRHGCGSEANPILVNAGLGGGGAGTGAAGAGGAGGGGGSILYSALGGSLVVVIAGAGGAATATSTGGT